MISLSTALKATNNLSRIILTSLRPGVLQVQPAAGVKSLEEQIGLPPKPKKPLTPFFRFMRDLRPVIMAEKPKLKVTEIVKIISQKWETADPSLKQKLLEQYKTDKVSYVESRAKYDSKVTDEQRSEIKQLKQNVIASKEKRLIKKRIALLERPKKPPSAFLMFIANERKATPQSSDQTYREWHAKMTIKWSKLSDDEKQVYLQAFREKQVKYKEDMTVWEEKMVRLGNIDVVRPEILIDPPAKKKLKPQK